MAGKVLRRVGIGVGVVVGLVFVLTAFIYVASNARLNKHYAIDVPRMPLPTDAASLARGEHVARAIAKCVDCHGGLLEGNVVVDDPALGRFAAPNLTAAPTGVGASLRDRDWFRAIRHGVAPDGRPLLLMPSDGYTHLSDSDLVALVAWARSRPLVENPVPTSRLGPLGRVLLLAGKFPILAAEAVDHSVQHVSAPSAGVTVEYGRYLVLAGGCTDCHGPGLSGGKVPKFPPDAPPAANLTPAGISGWTEAMFFAALREGKDPSGRSLDRRWMPWKATAKMTDDEIRAVWIYLQTVPSRQFGNR
jgi:mono/diheme cytochrome c family protein